MYDDTAVASLIGVLGGFLIVLVLLVIAFAIFNIIGMWKLYEKAGQPGWKAIIPFYNTWTLVEMVGLNWYWFLLCIATTICTILGLTSLSYIANIAGIFGNVMICYNMAKKLHKDTGWIVLAVIFNAIVLPIMGYSKEATWDKEAAVTANAFFDNKKEK